MRLLPLLVLSLSLFGCDSVVLPETDAPNDAYPLRIDALAYRFQEGPDELTVRFTNTGDSTLTRADLRLAFYTDSEQTPQSITTIPLFGESEEELPLTAGASGEYLGEGEFSGLDAARCYRYATILPPTIDGGEPQVREYDGTCAS